MQWRQHIRSQLIPLTHGERVASHIINSPSDQLGALSKNEAAAASYRAIRDKLSRMSGDVSIDDTLARQRTELSSFKVVLQLDVDRRLTPSGLSIENLAAIYSARMKLIEAKAAIDGSPLASAVRSLAPGKVEFASTIEALNWISAGAWRAFTFSTLRWIALSRCKQMAGKYSERRELSLYNRCRQIARVARCGAIRLERSRGYGSPIAAPPSS